MPKTTVDDRRHIGENISFSTNESYKRMRTNIIFSLPQDDACKVIGITSAQPGEGKSTSAVNLTCSFAELGKKVLLIDMDMRRPSVGEKLDLDGSLGFGDLLTESNDLSSAVMRYKSETGKFCFDVICGKSIDNTSELLSSPRLPALLNTLRKAYDYIIADLPPVGAVIDAVIAGRQMDGMIIIAKENETPKKQFENCLKQLNLGAVKILGIVFNGSVENSGKKYKYKYGYGYGYGSGYGSGYGGY